MAENPIVMPALGGGQETHFAESEEDANISEMPDIMSKVMEWSSN